MKKENNIKTSIAPSFGGRAVPVGFNKPSNRIKIILYAYTDVTFVNIALYEYHGLYWYSLAQDGKPPKFMNSVGFVSLRNCVSGLRKTLGGLGLTLDNSDCIVRFVNAWERQEGKVS